MHKHTSYGRKIHIGGASPKETEILAFRLCNERLSRCNDGSLRIDALNKTHELWSLLVRDLTGNNNLLPETLKEQLVGIGFWAMAYCIAAMSRDLPVQPLIDVNQNILEGLCEQRAAMPVIDKGKSCGTFLPA